MEEEKMIDDTKRPEEYEQGNESSEEMGNDSETSEYDFDTLNLQLDELNSALDQLEQKNDLIHAQLVDLLQSNRETREHFQAILASFEITRPQG